MVVRAIIGAFAALGTGGGAECPANLGNVEGAEAMFCHREDAPHLAWADMWWGIAEVPCAES